MIGYGQPQAIHPLTSKRFEFNPYQKNVCDTRRKLYVDISVNGVYNTFTLKPISKISFIGYAVGDTPFP